ncbi:Ras GTPase activation domain-containing protein [Cavenderia fasciculata]|uniref:Ras GTPase activation domain-containing protein n=1 Tax=Cavenderia fasciculata TaxID=261658 RepID=F4PJZ2_CACFS|nr:Ras GTPase activation domain-containing protein [Cavenderia fasciculata]EGG23916.1 Ras GTPase activation domain-containing protein [Cavenderia fasciculata]|eukprot:XP_004361767.1 Ras GTPase activation domain-containing protein [Cavenderia fasciculata]
MSDLNIQHQMSSSPSTSNFHDNRKSVYIQQSNNNSNTGRSPQRSGGEWGFVGKIGVAKTSVLQKIGKVEVTQSTPELVINNIKAKALKLLYEDTLRTSKKLVSKLEAQDKATENLKTALTAITNYYTNESMTGQSIESVVTLHNELIQYRIKFEQSINNRYILPADAFLQTTINPARDAKAKFRKARLEYDSALNKLKMVQGQKELDAKSLFSAHGHHAQYKLKYLHRQYDAHHALHDTITRHSFEYLVQSINLLASEYDHYGSTCAYLTQMEPFIQEMRTHAEKQRQEYQEKKQEETNALLEIANEKEETKFNELVEIFSSADLAVVNAICLSSGSDQDNILEDLVKILDAHKQTLPIIKLGISKEVESTPSASTLFRGNSTATKLMTAFTRMTGCGYLKTTLKPLIERITKDPSGYELDPDKGVDTTGNSERLQGICQEFLESIYSSLNHCPLPFREMANHLQTEVVKRFPDSKHTSVGGFIFLRFFCPCILSPDSAGVVDTSSLTMEARRSLILVSKVLQNVANGILFGAKEAYMKEMNSFLERNIEGVKVFLDNVATLPPSTDYTPLASIQEVKAKELPSIHKLLIKNLEKIFKTLGQYNQQSVTFSLVSALGRLGDTN